MVSEIGSDQLAGDDIEVEGLVTAVDVHVDYIEQVGQAHSVVSSGEQEEGHDLQEVKDQHDVQEVLGDTVVCINADMVIYRVELTVGILTAVEIKELSGEILKKSAKDRRVTKAAGVKEDFCIET